MKIAFQMEALEETVRGDNNSLLLMQEACRRGHEVYHFQPAQITLSDQGIFAPLTPAQIDLSRDDFYTLGERQVFDLSTLDMILFRQDPPFDMNYVTNTFILEKLRARGVMVVNNPAWIRDMPDKLSIFDYADFLPPTLVTRDLSAIEQFFKTHKDVVIKPLYGYHGHGVVRAAKMEEAHRQLKLYPEPLMFQPFLKEILDGNKRIVLFDGEIAGCIKNVPASEEEFRVLRTSVDIAYEPAPREIELCARLAPLLKERGLYFVGLDLIGPYLTEINVGSVGSLLRLNRVYGGRSEERLWDILLHKLREFKNS